MNGKYFDTWLAIGLNILHYRKERGMTQEQLAEKSNISRNYIQRIETAASSCTVNINISFLCGWVVVYIYVNDALVSLPC